MHNFFHRIQKLIHKLTILDFIFGLLITGMAIFALYYFDRQERDVFVDVVIIDNNYGTITALDKWTADRMLLGDVVYSKTGQEAAKIVDLQIFPAEKEEKVNVFLTLKIHALYETRSKQLFFQGKALAVGQPLGIDTSSYSLYGQIIDVYENEAQRHSAYVSSQAKIKIRVSGIDNEIVNEYTDLSMALANIQSPIQILNQEKRASKIISVQPSGKTLISADPLHSDMYYELQLPVLCKKNNQQSCYYNLHDELLIGQKIIFSTPTLIINGEILEIHLDSYAS